MRAEIRRQSRGKNDSHPGQGAGDAGAESVVMETLSELFIIWSYRKLLKKGDRHVEVWTFTVLSRFLLSLTTPDLSLFPLKDLTDRDRSRGMTCRGLVKSISGGEGRHLPGHLREAQFAIPVQVEHPQLLGTERGAWVICFDRLSCGTLPAIPFYRRGKKMGGACLCLL